MRPNKLDLQDVIEMEIGEKSSSMFRSSKHEVFSHQFFMDEEIGPPSKYRDLIHALYTAGPNDQFNIMVNSCGGFLSSAMAIIEAFKSTDATVRAIIVGECHSAASMISLNCHEIIVTDAAHMMVHTASYGAGGSTGNVKSHTDFSTDFINKMLDSTYTGFLLEDEMSDMKKGVELWFDAKQIRSRLDKRLKHLESKNKKKSKITPTPPV